VAIFQSDLNISKVKDAVLGCRLFSTYNDLVGVVGRSMAWKVRSFRSMNIWDTDAILKLFLTPQEPLQSISDQCSTPPLDSLRASRREYVTTLLDKMRAPDGSYPEGFIAPGISTSSMRSQATGSLEKNNPLSLHNEVGIYYSLSDKTRSKSTLVESMDRMVRVTWSAENGSARCWAHVSGSFLSLPVHTSVLVAFLK